MRSALDGVCVFIGLSFTDQNLLRWIYRSTGTDHIAVLARQSSPRLAPDVRRELRVRYSGTPPARQRNRPLGRLLRDNALGLGLWGLDYDNREVTLWASSDRVHVDASTITAVPLAWASEWVAVEAITQGSVVEWDPDVYASRWRSVRGIPLIWTGPEERERILVGAATLTTTKSAGSSIFDAAEQLAPGIRKVIDRSLHDQLVRLWD